MRLFIQTICLFLLINQSALADNASDWLKTEIDYIVNSYTNEDISDNKMTLWLKKIFKHGMSFKETILYTNSIIDSGERITFDNQKGYVIDKHSTGGVGDKVSIISAS